MTLPRYCFRLILNTRTNRIEVFSTFILLAALSLQQKNTLMILPGQYRSLVILKKNFTDLVLIGSLLASTAENLSIVTGAPRLPPVPPLALWTAYIYLLITVR